jgi:hypothetical protein
LCRRPTAVRGTLALALAVGTPVRVRRGWLTGRKPCHTRRLAGPPALVDPPLALQRPAFPVVSQPLAQPGRLVALVSDLVPFGGEVLAFGGDEVTPIHQPCGFLGLGGLLGVLGCGGPRADSGTASSAYGDPGGGVRTSGWERCWRGCTGWPSRLRNHGTRGSSRRSVSRPGSRRWTRWTRPRRRFAAGLARLVPELVALEELLPCPVRGDERRCHLDLDDSNLAWDDRGQLVILDWENSGPASPISELAMVAAEYGPDRALGLCRSYWDAGGPAVLRAPTDFATAVAVQGHLIEFYSRRWLTAADPEDRSRSEWRMSQQLDAPLTRTRIAEVLTAVRR